MTKVFYYSKYVLLVIFALGTILFLFSDPIDDSCITFIGYKLIAFILGYMTKKIGEMVFVNDDENINIA